MKGILYEPNYLKEFVYDAHRCAFLLKWRYSPFLENRNMQMSLRGVFIHGTFLDESITYGTSLHDNSKYEVFWSLKERELCEKNRQKIDILINLE